MSLIGAPVVQMARLLEVKARLARQDGERQHHRLKMPKRIDGVDSRAGFPRRDERRELESSPDAQSRGAR